MKPVHILPTHPRCIDCRFAVEQAEAPNSLRRVMACRFLPPQIVPIKTPSGPALLAAFPNVSAEMYCFHFEARELSPLDEDYMAGN